MIDVSGRATVAITVLGPKLAIMDGKGTAFRRGTGSPPAAIVV
jgi:hypothetical protein